MSSAYYSDDLVTIYHGDWLDLSLSFSSPTVLVTDPPYGVGYDGDASTRNGHVHPLIVGDDRPFDPAPLLDLDVPSILWGGNHYGSRLPDSPSWLIWDKRNGDFGNSQADCEMAWTNLGGPARIFRYLWMGGSRAGERGTHYHPTQKPEALMRWCIERSPDGMVFDPYMGSGTTLVAAKSLGRRAIGIEIEERYCEIAAKRCSQEVLGLTA